MRMFVTGAAGFIGSNLVDRLLAAGHDVIGFDNLSTGCRRFLDSAMASPRFQFVEGDVLDLVKLTSAARGTELVFHLAANADVRFGTEHPSRDLTQNTIATFNVLEAMRSNGMRRIVFSSTGSVYGEAAQIPTPEDARFPIQTSLYGASKLAGEGLVAAYCEGFAFQGYIFRFVSIMGERYTHGHVFDFYKSLLANPNELYILGNGKQRKSYLYVQDCIDAMLLALERASHKINIFNVGCDEYCEVNESVNWINQQLGLSPELKYRGGDRGWVGDNPFIFLDCRKIRALGWQPKLTIQESVVRTLIWLASNRWALDRLT
jgi:UDP-glucose 4-epimerase